MFELANARWALVCSRWADADADADATDSEAGDNLNSAATQLQSRAVMSVMDVAHPHGGLKGAVALFALRRECRHVLR